MDSLFPELGEAPKQEPLVEPVEVMVCVARDKTRENAVFISIVGSDLMWVPRKLIRFDGLGEQRVQIEKWKAKELGLI